MKNVKLKLMEDGSIKIKINILNITTYAKDKDDIQNAINEAIELLKNNAHDNGCVETIRLIKLWCSNI